MGAEQRASEISSVPTARDYFNQLGPLVEKWNSLEDKFGDRFGGRFINPEPDNPEFTKLFESVLETSIRLALSLFKERISIPTVREWLRENKNPKTQARTYTFIHFAHKALLKEILRARAAARSRTE